MLLRVVTVRGESDEVVVDSMENDLFERITFWIINLSCKQGA